MYSGRETLALPTALVQTIFLCPDNFWCTSLISKDTSGKQLWVPQMPEPFWSILRLWILKIKFFFFTIRSAYQKITYIHVLYVIGIVLYM